MSSHAGSYTETHAETHNMCCQLCNMTCTCLSFCHPSSSPLHEMTTMQDDLLCLLVFLMTIMQNDLTQTVFRLRNSPELQSAGLDVQIPLHMLPTMRDDHRQHCVLTCLSARQAVHQSGFAGARGPHQTRELVRPEGPRNIL